jgi:GYF domain 2
MQAERQWYFSREGKQYGPFSEVELVDFYWSNQLHPTDLFWCQGFSEWQPHSVLFGSQQQQPAATQSEDVHREVAQSSPPSRDEDQGREVVVRQSDEPEKTPLAVWGCMVAQLIIALPGAMLLGAGIAHAYRYLMR